MLELNILTWKMSTLPLLTYGFETKCRYDLRYKPYIHNLSVMVKRIDLHQELGFGVYTLTSLG